MELYSLISQKSFTVSTLAETKKIIGSSIFDCLEAVANSARQEPRSYFGRDQIICFSGDDFAICTVKKIHVRRLIAHLSLEKPFLFINKYIEEFCALAQTFDCELFQFDTSIDYYKNNSSFLPAGMFLANYILHNKEWLPPTKTEAKSDPRIMRLKGDESWFDNLISEYRYLTISKNLNTCVKPPSLASLLNATKDTRRKISAGGCHAYVFEEEGELVYTHREAITKTEAGLSFIYSHPSLRHEPQIKEIRAQCDENFEGGGALADVIAISNFPSLSLYISAGFNISRVILNREI